MSLTDEQNAVVRSSSKKLVVNALAGSGKTSTAKAWIQGRPQQRILYLTFNKSAADKMKDDISREGLRNISAMTIHSCAYRFLNIANLGRELRSFTPRELSSVIGGKLSSSRHVWVRGARLVLDRLAAFCRSDIADPHTFCEMVPLPDTSLKCCEDIEVHPDRINDSFLFLWKELLQNQNYPLDHNVYLKYFQLVGTPLPYDAIVVDEAQDLAAVTESIVLRSLTSNADLLLLGDTFQQIYSWNGSVNAMSRMVRNGADVLALTQSFRCPETVTSQASAFLRLLGYEGAFHGMPGPVALDHNIDTWLFRSNSGVFEKLLEVSHQCDGDFSRVHLVGGANSYNLQEIADVALLKQGHISRNPNLAGFPSFNSYEEYCLEARDRQGSVCCKLIRKYGADEILSQYSKIQSSHFAASPYEADIAISTAHKSKGQEFSRVHLGQDFYNLESEWGNFLSKKKATPKPSEAASEAPISPFLDSLLDAHYPPEVRQRVSMINLIGKKAIIRSGTFIPRPSESATARSDVSPGRGEAKTFQINAEEYRLLYVAMTRAADMVDGYEPFQVTPNLWRRIFNSGEDVRFVDLDQFGNWLPYQPPLGSREGCGQVPRMSLLE